MTEQEAKTKWCPMARAGSGDRTVNRTYNEGKSDLDCKCLASECTRWLWNKELWDGKRYILDGRCGLAR